MKKRIAKLLALLLSALMLVCTFAGLVSCKKENTKTSETDTGKETDTTPETQGIEDYKTILPKATFDSADVNILVMENRAWQFLPEETTADVIQNELLARNSYVEENYDVYLNFVPITTGWNGFHSQCQQDMWAGTAEYDITSPDYYYQTETAGYFLNLADLDAINLDNPYWVQGWNKSATINGKIFTAISYLTLDPICNANAIAMNNNLATDLSIKVDDVKELVYDNAWTLTAMQEYMALASNENGDDAWDFNDRYGLAYNLWGGRAILWGAGLQLSTMNEDGTVSQTFTSSHNVELFSAVYKFFNQNAYSYYGGEQSTSDVGDRALFFSNRALFRTISLAECSLISSELDSFSVLPCPKYSTTQEDYVTSLLGSVVFGIMTTAKDPVMSATILEALSILTYEDVRPVYYNKGLKLRYSTDEDTAKMIDLIISKTEVDFAFINSSSFGTVADKPFNLIVDYNSNYVSQMKKFVDMFEQNLENFYDVYSDKTPSDSETDTTDAETPSSESPQS